MELFWLGAFALIVLYYPTKWFLKATWWFIQLFWRIGVVAYRFWQLQRVKNSANKTIKTYCDRHGIPTIEIEIEGQYQMSKKEEKNLMKDYKEMLDE